MTQTQSGGCQCGAVRFRVSGALGDASICHCRMCQKAFGAFHAPLVSVGEASLEWTRGSAQRFALSNHASRLFCEKCGTPLGYDAPDGIGLAIGAFDDPVTIVPERQWGIEAKLPYLDKLNSLPSSRTEEDTASAPFLAAVINFQHPDHDTTNWPREHKT
jgi:hypothetical protein